MSTMQVLEELSKMSAADRKRVQQRLLELEAERSEAERLQEEKQGSVWEDLMALAGKAEGLPSDLAAQHDHYLHGTTKREE